MKKFLALFDGGIWAVLFVAAYMIFLLAMLASYIRKKHKQAKQRTKVT